MARSIRGGVAAYTLEGSPDTVSGGAWGEGGKS